MGSRATAVCGLVLALVSGAASAQEEAAPPRAQPLAYSDRAGFIRLVPLRQGQLPDLTEGEVLRPTCGRDVDPEQPAGLRWLPNGDLLVWQGRQPGTSHYARDDQGRMVEVFVGDWPAGWSCQGSADVDGDGQLDLLLSRKVGEGHRPFEYKIAFGKPDGSFEHRTKPTRIFQSMWTAVFDLVDADGDAVPDLVYHSQPHGGDHPVSLYALKGRGDGTFAPERERICLLEGTVGAAMSGIVLEDFNSDCVPDLFLPPDDDVPDNGQAYLALGWSKGLRAPEPSVDFVPQDEGWTSDEGSYRVQTCDVDLDMAADLIVWFYSWRDPSYSVKVYWGNGRGGFGDPETLLQGRTQKKPSMAWFQTAIEW